MIDAVVWDMYLIAQEVGVHAGYHATGMDLTRNSNLLASVLPLKVLCVDATVGMHAQSCHAHLNSNFLFISFDQTFKKPKFRRPAN